MKNYRGKVQFFMKRLLVFTLCFCLFSSMITVNPAVVKAASPLHPFLIVTESEFPALREKLNHPDPIWADMKADAELTVANGYVDSLATVNNTIIGNTMSAYIGSAALLYVLTEEQQYAHMVYNAIQDLSHSSIKTGDNHDWNQVTPVSSLLFASIIGLDTVYNGLTSSQIASCESKIQARLNTINRTGGWQLVRYGAHGTWDIYKGVRTSPDNQYYNTIMDQLSTDGIGLIGVGYSYARFSQKDRYAKNMYMHVLEHTGVDNRYYNNDVIQNFYEWLYGHAMTSAKNFYTIGDTSYDEVRFDENYLIDTPVFGVGKFSDVALESAAHLMADSKIQGNILSYALLDEPFKSTTVKGSRIFRDGGAYFAEATGSEEELCVAMSNTARKTGHGHPDQNSLLIGGYGESILLNTGYYGWGRGILGYSFSDISNNENYNNIIKTSSTYNKNHGTGLSGGIVEGFTSDAIDYASGSDGQLQEEELYRNLAFIKSQPDANGYIVVFDEVNNATNNVIQRFHPNSKVTSELSTPVATISDKEHYRASINGYVIDESEDVKLDVFYGTEPSSVNVINGIRSSWGNSFVGKSLEANYQGNGDLNITTVLYPSDASHSASSMTRLNGGNDYSGILVEHNSKLEDIIIASNTSSVINYTDINFSGKSAIVRKSNNDIQSFFVRQGKSFNPSTNYGFTSDEDVTLYLDGNEGNIITQEDVVITINYPGIKTIKLNGSDKAIYESNADSITLGIPAGEYTVELLTTGVPTYEEQPVPSEEEIIAPTDDAYTRGGSYGNTQFGGDDGIAIKNDGNSNSSYNRNGYLKFNVPNPSTVESATLRVYGNNFQDASNIAIDCIGLDNDTWNEATITWNNAPTGQESVLSTVPVNAVAKYYEFDVTSFVQGQSDDVVTLMLKNTLAQDRVLAFMSKESQGNHPELVITRTEDTPMAPLAPMADTFIRNGSHGNSNYGTSGVLDIKNDGDGYTRHAYLKFDVSNYSSVDSAILRVYGGNTQDSSTVMLKAFGLSDDAWSETGLTWNNAPSGQETELCTVDVDITQKYYEFDITAFVQQQLSDGVVSIALKDSIGYHKAVSFRSKENAENRPELVLDGSVLLP